MHPLIQPVRLANSSIPASSPTPPAAATTPFQMRHFYGIDNINLAGVAGDGRGQTIAIVDAFDDPNAQSDLQSFDAYYGLPDPPSFQRLDQNGGTNYPSQDAPGTGSWEVEESLDIEWSHVIAPAANIVLLEADDNGPSNLFQAVSTAASLPNVVCVSMSFGNAERLDESAYDSTFTMPAGHQPVTFLAASGDQGAPGLYPAYSPNVVAVGGTSITFAAGTIDGTYGSETTWNNSHGATGGGISSIESKPGYQNFLPGTNRAMPDVAMDSDPLTGVAIYDSYDFTSSTPWAQYGGTSLATPMWAGLIAIADQGRASVNQPSLNGPSQVLPLLYTTPAVDFHDITTGNNNGYSAGPGYDEVTGLGTPLANKIVNVLSGVSASPAQASASSGAGITISQSADHLYIDWTLGASSGNILIGDTNGLSVTGDASDEPINLDYSHGNPLPNTLALNGTFTLNGLQGSNPLVGKLLDIDRSTVYVNYADGPDLLANIQQYLQSGYNNGAWNGAPTASTGVITSSPAAANANQTTAIGYADAADGLIAGQPANTIELKYTLYGDTTLTGTVGFNDFTRLTQHYNQTTGGAWDTGDFNYDGSIDSNDFNLLSRTYGMSLGGAAAPAVAAATLTTTNTSPSTSQPPTIATKGPSALSRKTEPKSIRKHR